MTKQKEIPNKLEKIERLDPWDYKGAMVETINKLIDAHNQPLKELPVAPQHLSEKKILKAADKVGKTYTWLERHGWKEETELAQYKRGGYGDGWNEAIKESNKKIRDKEMIKQKDWEKLWQDAEDHWNSSENEETRKFWRDVLTWLTILKAKEDYKRK